MRRHITLIAAARPNFMKVAPLIHALEADPNFSFTLVHTGQHFDAKMSDTFFKQLNIPNPDVNLNIGSGSHAYQTGMVMIKFEEYLSDNATDMVVVFGDVNSTVACSMAAVKCGVPVAHVESGLRSFDRKMPEEINRIITDGISDILYTPSEDANVQLSKEGVSDDRVVFVGNIMIDTLLAQKPAADRLNIRETLGLLDKPYALLTLHRPSNVDDRDVFFQILEAIKDISQDVNLVWPIHPRSKKNAKSFGFLKELDDYIQCVDPLGYHEMLNLMSHARCVITDSGGLQEETTALGVPCVTVRENTERPITISEGTNVLAGTSKEGILEAYSECLKQSDFSVPKYWDGNTSFRIVEHFKSFFS